MEIQWNSDDESLDAMRKSLTISAESSGSQYSFQTWSEVSVQLDGLTVFPAQSVATLFDAEMPKRVIFL